MTVCRKYLTLWNSGFVWRSLTRKTEKLFSKRGISDMVKKTFCHAERQSTKITLLG